MRCAWEVFQLDRERMVAKYRKLRDLTVPIRACILMRVQHRSAKTHDTETR